MAAANSTSRSSCFPVCVVNLPTTWLPRRLPRFESKMSRHGLRKRSAKPCYRYAEESLAVVSLRSWKQKPPNSLLIQDKTFYNLGVSLTEGYRGEVNLAMEDWTGQLASALDRGVILTIDYGQLATDLYAPQNNQGTLVCYHRHVVSSDQYQQ